MVQYIEAFFELVLSFLTLPPQSMQELEQEKKEGKTTTTKRRINASRTGIIDALLGNIQLKPSQILIFL